MAATTSYLQEMLGTKPSKSSDEAVSYASTGQTIGRYGEVQWTAWKDSDSDFSRPYVPHYMPWNKQYTDCEFCSPITQFITINFSLSIFVYF